MFAGLKQFASSSLEALARDLQRLNGLLVTAFEDAERSAPRRFNVVRVTGAAYTAKHWDFILAGFNQDAVITLPTSSAEHAGASVRVARAGTGAVSVAPPAQESLNGSKGLAVTLASGGFEDFAADGQAGWWESL